MAPEPINVTDSGSIKTETVHWLARQEFNNVMLFLILAAMTGGVFLAVKYAIPAHLSQIQAGYTQINDANLKQRAEDRDTFIKTLDRIEKIYAEKR